VWTAQFATQWLPDTPSHRHLTVVWWRLLVEEHGQPFFTLHEWAALVGRANRQAASQHLEDVRPCGEDVRAFVLRQRKVEATVVDAVWAERRHTPWAGPTELVVRVHTQLGRQDLTAANIASALEQIAGGPVRRTLRRQLEASHVRYQAAYVRTEILANPAPRPGPSVPWGVPSSDRGMPRTAPTALAALVTPELPLERVSGSLCWLTCLMTLC
jgi:hypothetical protein